jgi:hypothetical protein
VLLTEKPKGQGYQAGYQLLAGAQHLSSHIECNTKTLSIHTSNVNTDMLSIHTSNVNTDMLSLHTSSVNTDTFIHTSSISIDILSNSISSVRCCYDHLITSVHEHRSPVQSFPGLRQVLPYLSQRPALKKAGHLHRVESKVVGGEGCRYLWAVDEK